MSAVPARTGHLTDSPTRRIAVGVTVLALIVGATAVTSEGSDWQPPALVLALTAALVAADAASVVARRIRISSGLMVQTTIMALLGPGPAVAAAACSTFVEARIHRFRLMGVLHNLVIFSVLGLVGGLLFEGLADVLGLERTDAAYAALVLPIYALLSGLNLFLVVSAHPDLAPGTRLRAIRETGPRALPLEAVNAVMAAAAVYVGARAGLATAAAVVMVLAVTIPLARTVADALKSGDALVELRQVSDERAAEVERLASDRERLLSEMLKTEERERARLAERLHDGPMQRFIAIRQDAAEAGPETDPALTERLDKAIAETRSLISAFHPATVRELGFEASLRAAVEPFPAAQSVRVAVRTEVNDQALAESLMLPIAQELVVNALKHAGPTTIDVVVHAEGDSLVLEVNDDGIGIDSAQAGRAVRAGHLGLAMVRQRVETAGGQFDLDTRLDGGTRSRVVLPWL
jgi:signal transduction histidine kinase